MNRTPAEWMILPLRRYAQFSGRACRAEYWWFALFALVVSLLASGIDYALGLDASGPVGTAVSLGLACPQLAVAFRRLHDIDRSGWWAGGPLVLVVPLVLLGVATLFGGGLGVLLAIVGIALIVYAVLLLVWACTPGTRGPNAYGPDPLARD